ncbi:SAF domain-containing protein [Luteimicrobium sp. NPDC057192]|uniref:SAF domain-containing protein n=1 Tax=Luteimicrobium sp. NPDC057192 TaxID=3346042 RepID=UPI003637026B
MTTTLRPTLEPLPTPVTPRLRRPTWRDPRLLVGCALVAGSVALGATVVSSARDTAPVYVAAHDLVPGDPVEASDLRVVDVNLGGEASRYLAPEGDGLTAGSVATSVVRSGELVPRTALGKESDVTVRAVAVPVSGTLSDRVRTGSTVDVWFVPKAASGTVVAGGADDAGAPRRLTQGAVVAQVDEPGSSLVVGGQTTVQVLVRPGDLPAVLAALAADGTVTVVPGGAK